MCAACYRIASFRALVAQEGKGEADGEQAAQCDGSAPSASKAATPGAAKRGSASDDDGWHLPERTPRVD